VITVEEIATQCL